MNIFRRLQQFFMMGGKPTGSDRYLPLYVYSNRCREAVEGQVDLMNELSLDDSSDRGGYFVRKVLHTASNRCFSQVEIQLWFDPQKKLITQEVTGGRWLTAAEYAEELRKAEERRLAAAADAPAGSPADAQVNSQAASSITPSDTSTQG